MANVYKSPGVYVEEVPSGNAPIVGAGTSTAAFIGAFDFVGTPDPVADVKAKAASTTPGQTTWRYSAVAIDKWGQTAPAMDVEITDGAAALDKTNSITITWTAPASVDRVLIYRQTAGSTLPNTTGLISIVPASDKTFTDTGVVGDGTKPQPVIYPPGRLAATQVVSCNNFGDFAATFGSLKYLPDQPGHKYLAHAVYGFFQNGGTHCYVVRLPQNWTPADFDAALTALEPIDDISIVAAPGMVSASVVACLIAHCEVTAKDRFAIFDSPPGATPEQMRAESSAYKDIFVGISNHAALYYPWIQVADPMSSGRIEVPPSGHVAGVYARVDATRGVHKAPANEQVLGALGVVQLVSRRQQDLLNPDGINCIRRLNGGTLIWGARTLGGDKHPEVKYVPVRRLLNYLRVSIDKGTQWTVFEPNSPDLWAKVVRNIRAFLMGVWSSGALFGTTPDRAFYVKCDEENNPQAERDKGYLHVEIGVAIVRPAEFVVFTISQWAGPQK